MTSKQFQLLYYAVRLAHPGNKVSARMPLAISRLETGNWKANSFVSYRNFFGMTAPNARDTTATNKGSGKVATYDNVLDSMSDWFLWCKAFGITNDAQLDTQIRTLKYNTNPKYPGTIDGIVKSIAAADEYLPEMIFEPVVLGAGAVLSVGAAYAAFQAMFGED